jgi:uncharacterized protein YggE
MCMRSMFCGCLVLWLVSLPASAQDEPGTVSGNGMVHLQRQPMLLRMSVELSGKGKTVQEALSRLKDRREVALLKVEGLKADKDSIEISPPQISAAALQQRQQFEQMLQQRMRVGGRLGKQVKLPETVTVSATLTVEWPLSADSPEQLLSSSSELQKAVTEADLAGLKEPQKLSPEEQEFAEEMQEMASQYGGFGESETKPGEAKFVFVARISQEDRQQAMAEAFTKARDSAALLAAAAGRQLGELVNIDGGGMGGGDPTNDFYYGESSYYMMERMRRSLGALGRTAEGESVAPIAGPVDFVFNVHATFHLK